MQQIIIEPKSSIRRLAMIAVALVALHLISYVPVTLGIRETPIHTFNLDDECNFAAVFSTFLMIICAVLTWFIGRAQAGTTLRLKWMGWALIFIFLGLDELMSFHERLAWAVHHGWSGLNLYGFAWVLPYGVACLLLILIYFKFWWELPVPTRRRVVLGAALFILGAIGFELVAWRLVRMDADPIFWHIEILVEEVLEITAGIILVWAFMRHITDVLPESCLMLRRKEKTETIGDA